MQKIKINLSSKPAANSFAEFAKTMPQVGKATIAKTTVTVCLEIDKEKLQAVADLLAQLETERAAIEALHKKEVVQPLKLVIPNQYMPQVRSEFKEAILRTVAGATNGKTEVFFNISTAKTADQRTLFIVRIVQALSDIYQKNWYNKHQKELSDMVRVLKDIDVEQTHIQFEKVSGATVIELGLSKKMLIEEQFYDIYFGLVINPTAEYIIKHPEPILLAPPKPANHKELIEIHYEYGEMEQFGNGLKYAVEYFNTIAKLHNEQLAMEKEAAKPAGLKILN